MVFCIAGIAHAQYGNSDSAAGQSSTGQGATGQREAPRPSEKDKYGIPKEQEHMDTGYVDQKKRVERASDPASPSKDTHVPEFTRDKEGRPIKDPKDEQGGPIGPN
jgi:hypothetical protein